MASKHVPQRQGAIKVPRDHRATSSPAVAPTVVAAPSQPSATAPTSASRRQSDEMRRGTGSPGTHATQHTLPASNIGPGQWLASTSTTQQQPQQGAIPSTATELRAGLAQKQFVIPTDLLTSKSPYFVALAQQQPSTPLVTATSSMVRQTSMRGPFFFPDLDEYAMALFLR